MQSEASNRIQLKFWGVRGSIACPGADTVIYGGNTPCLELRFGDHNNRRIVIDAGTGIRLLGNELSRIARPPESFPIDIFLTHTHWDHINGIPFFAPLYQKGFRINIYGPMTFENEPLEQVVGGQMRYHYFPVMHSDLAADITYHVLKEGRMDFGDGIALNAQYLNHTLLCLGYCFTYRGKKLCTAFDTEPYWNIFLDKAEEQAAYSELAREGEIIAAEESDRQYAFFQGADILIHDAQFTLEEYNDARRGWGHSAFEHAVDAALKAKVKTLVLFHHNPDRTDTELIAIEKRLSTSHRNAGLDIRIAKEGMTITL